MTNAIDNTNFTVSFSMGDDGARENYEVAIDGERAHDLKTVLHAVLNVLRAAGFSYVEGLTAECGEYEHTVLTCDDNSIYDMAAE